MASARYDPHIEKLSARRVLVAREVSDHPASRSRLEALLSRIDADSVEVVSGSELERTLLELGRRQDLERGGLAGRRRPKELVAFGRLGDREVFPGYSWRELRSGGRQQRDNGVLCQTAVEIQTAVGCPFECSYCPYSSFVCMRLDVPEIVERVVGLTEERPSQTLYKLNNRTDTLGLEPEYDLARVLVERFASIEGRYLMLYSKGDAVDHLLDLDHRGKTVASFTLTPSPIAALLEAGAPPPAARIAAMGRLARAGYPIRVRFSPIVPVRGWRDLYAELVTAVFEAAEPEMITLWTLSMIDVEELDRILPPGVLEPAALAAARAAAGRMRGDKGAPFPPGLRSAIYADVAALVREHSRSTHVALCLEAPAVWEASEPLVQLGRGGTAEFLCNCGPRATPERLAG